jgi:hypothetical protein
MEGNEAIFFNAFLNLPYDVVLYRNWKAARANDPQYPASTLDKFQRISRAEPGEEVPRKQRLYRQQRYAMRRASHLQKRE